MAGARRKGYTLRFNPHCTPHGQAGESPPSTTANDAGEKCPIYFKVKPVVFDFIQRYMPESLQEVLKPLLGEDKPLPDEPRPEGVERRQQERFKTSKKLCIKVYRPSHATSWPPHVIYWIDNISLGGVGCRTKDTPPPWLERNMQVIVQIDIGSANFTRAMMNIRWFKENRMGLSFSQMNKNDLNRLMEEATKKV